MNFSALSKAARLSVSAPAPAMIGSPLGDGVSEAELRRARFSSGFDGQAGDGTGEVERPLH
jgi:hypothetical protein